MKTAIVNCNVIDGISPAAIRDATVFVDQGRITQVATRDATGSVNDALVIDAGGSWLLPGLWDVHVHMGYARGAPANIGTRVIAGGLNVAAALRQAGITSIRTAGVEQWMDVAWREAFASGAFLGPRIFAGGYFIRTTAGHFAGDPSTVACDGAVEFMRTVREQIENGVDHIKLNLSGGVVGPAWDKHRRTFLVSEELEAAFAVAHQRGFKVMCHATNPDAVKAAVKLGAWSVEHGYVMDEECIELMLANGTFYVPTLTITHLTPSRVTNEWERQWLEKLNPTDSVIARAEAAYEEHRKWFETALRAGVKMAVGSDNYLGALKDATLLELGLWVKDGATPMETIIAATRTASEACGVGDVLGTVEPGKLADLIIVARNPLEDIDNIRALEMVFKEGQLVVDKRKERGHMAAEAM